MEEEEPLRAQYVMDKKLEYNSSALDGTSQTSDDLLLEDREADQRRNHGQSRKGKHLSGVDGMLRAEHLHTKRQRILARIIQQEQRQHIGVPAGNES